MFLFPLFLGIYTAFQASWYHFAHSDYFFLHSILNCITNSNTTFIITGDFQNLS
ncbi:MAG: hypothetical protein JWP37_2529 [Mucilaginibacter sp.]|nr:hypothetical protein [Mucilaginibacter sp.]